MTPSCRKYNNFIVYPDLGHKFLLSSVRNVISPNIFTIYLKYIFSTHKTYTYIALKGLLMLSSIYPRRCQYSSRTIRLRYTKTRIHYLIFLPITLQILISFFHYHLTHPVSITTAMNSFIREAKHFVFPGFIKHLRLPSWEYTVNLSFKHIKITYLYTFFFYKIAYID